MARGASSPEPVQFQPAASRPAPAAGSRSDALPSSPGTHPQHPVCLGTSHLTWHLLLHQMLQPPVARHSCIPSREGSAGSDTPSSTSPALLAPGAPRLLSLKSPARSRAQLQPTAPSAEPSLRSASPGRVRRARLSELYKPHEPSCGALEVKCETCSVSGHGGETRAVKQQHHIEA